MCSRSAPSEDGLLERMHDHTRDVGVSNSTERSAKEYFPEFSPSKSFDRVRNHVHGSKFMTLRLDTCAFAYCAGLINRCSARCEYA
jgi:hypothetical protein